MLDRRVRGWLDPYLRGPARGLASVGVRPNTLTVAGFALGAVAAVAAGLAWWSAALVLWLVSRVADGLDGAVARVTGDMSDRGGFFDIVADFTVYGGFVVGCAVGQPAARLPLLVLLLTYYVNGTAFLAQSSIIERRHQPTGLEDERSLVFPTGLAEGTETIIAHSLFVLLPGHMSVLAWTFAAVVGVTIGQRVWAAARLLRT